MGVLFKKRNNNFQIQEAEPKKAFCVISGVEQFQWLHHMGESMSPHHPLCLPQILAS